MVDAKQEKQVLRALEHRKRLFFFSNVLVCSDGSRRNERVVDVPDGGDNEY
jgi:hypothetical protein